MLARAVASSSMVPLPHALPGSNVAHRTSCASSVAGLWARHILPHSSLILCSVPSCRRARSASAAHASIGPLSYNDVLLPDVSLSGASVLAPSLAVQLLTYLFSFAFVPSFVVCDRVRHARPLFARSLSLIVLIDRVRCCPWSL